MYNLTAATLQTIKNRLRISIGPDDDSKFGLNIKDPEPDKHCSPVVRQRWEERRQNPFLFDFTDRYNASVEHFEAARKTESVSEMVQLLKSLQLYLETQAGRPIADAGWIERDGKQHYWSRGRNMHYDDFFEERVLVIVRKAITDLEQIMTTLPSKGPKTSKPNRETLSACFEHHSKYVHVMRLLADGGYCHPNTGYATGKFNKAMLCGFIESLHGKGYYGRLGRPSGKETVLIAKNTFDVQLTENTYKKRVKDSTDWNFVPPASTFGLH